MNEIFRESSSQADISQQTPIEIALGVDAQGMTTATKLYGFLELNPSNYSKWFKKNITDNQFAEENIDYFPFVLKYEHANSIGERQDAKLTASFAKKLSMMQKNKKGEAARNYFVEIENGAKKLVKQVPLTEQPGEVAKLINATARLMERQGSAPNKVAENAQLICNQYGIRLIDGFVKVSEYEQMELWDISQGGEND